MNLGILHVRVVYYLDFCLFQLSLKVLGDSMVGSFIKAEYGQKDSSQTSGLPSNTDTNASKPLAEVLTFEAKG